ncbi:hypothetical protein HOY82DRAFT_558461 [Tuber indicum]|nr:hypothetical protein HOY82DRAFT_558461 [Tuber indicum]
MLLERGDVNPNHTDTEYGRTPLSWAAVRGHAPVVRTLLEREDVHPATPDRANQTPLSLALSNGYDRLAEIIRARGCANSNITDHVARHPSPPPPAIAASAMDMPFRDPNELELISDPKASLSDPANSDLPSTEHPRLHQPTPTQPLRVVDTRPNDPRSILAHAGRVDRCFTIACFVCLLAFLIYIIPSSFGEIFWLHN